jgi:type I restriction enzyme S subunit
MELKEPSAKYLISAEFVQTEVGKFPADWTTVCLGEVTTLMTNGFVGTATSHYTKSNDGVLYVQGYNVEENGFNFRGIKYVTPEFHRDHLRSCLREGDLLTIQTGDVGLTTTVPKSLAGSNCHALIISRFDHGRIAPKFVSYYLNSPPGRSRLQLIETGTTMKHLNVGDMLQFKIPLPPTKIEQERISEVLTDSDALIESLEQLLAKKRRVKQGAMQELLSGQRRLPGFSDEWTASTLGSLGFVYGGLSGKSKKDFGHGSALYIPFMNVMSSVVIDSAWLERVDIQPNETQNDVKQGDLLFNGSSETPEEVGMCSVLQHTIPNLFLNSFCFGFRLHAGAHADGTFLAYWFRSAIGRSSMSVLAQGATRYNIAKSAFVRLSLNLPARDEQTAIATVLSDIDTEITALEARLTKARQIKQGMAQALLTGRIRLVN